MLNKMVFFESNSSRYEAFLTLFTKSGEFAGRRGEVSAKGTLYQL